MVMSSSSFRSSPINLGLEESVVLEHLFGPIPKYGVWLLRTCPTLHMGTEVFNPVLDSYKTQNIALKMALWEEAWGSMSSLLSPLVPSPSSDKPLACIQCSKTNTRAILNCSLYLKLYILYNLSSCIFEILK